MSLLRIVNGKMSLIWGHFADLLSCEWAVWDLVGATVGERIWLCRGKKLRLIRNDSLHSLTSLLHGSVFGGGGAWNGVCNSVPVW